MKHQLETYLSHHPYRVCAACDEVAETGCEYCSSCLATVTDISERINDIRVMLRAPYGFLIGVDER